MLIHASVQLNFSSAPILRLPFLELCFLQKLLSTCLPIMTWMQLLSLHFFVAVAGAMNVNGNLSNSIIRLSTRAPQAGFVTARNPCCVAYEFSDLSTHTVVLGGPSAVKLDPISRDINVLLPGRKVLACTRYYLRQIAKSYRHQFLPIVLFTGATTLLPTPCFASNIPIPSPNNLKVSMVSLLDEMSRAGTEGMIFYATSFLIWTMTVGVTTPVETAAGMAFPVSKSIPLSAIGKIGGAFAQFTLARYVLSEWAREKMEQNEWFNKINLSFQSHPFRVALIWRFSPLPEFVKNVGPALVPTLKTRYQIMATLVHGLPFTVLWSCMGHEAAMVARGCEASLVLKRLVAGITWVGIFVSPTLFGCWLKGLGSEEEKNEA